MACAVAGNGCRVSVSLDRYYSDERSRARVAVDGRWVRVSGLARYLREVFGLRGAFCLVSAGHLLPPDEPLAPLLRDGDSLSIVPVEGGWSMLADEETASDRTDRTDATNRIDVTNRIDATNRIFATDRSDGDARPAAPVADVVDALDVAPRAPTSPSTDRSGKKKKKKKHKYEVEERPPEEPFDTSPAIGPMTSTSDGRTPSVPPTPPDTSPARPACPTRPPAGADEESLQAVKLRALALLSECVSARGVGGGRVTKRRRVRRRHSARAHTPPPPAPPAPHTPGVHTRFSPPPSPPPPVVQNATGAESGPGPGPGRVVRTLVSPPPPPDATWPAGDRHNGHSI